VHVHGITSFCAGCKKLQINVSAAISMKNKHGGQRKNAGRKKSAHPTTTIAFRVRLALVDEIKQLVKQFITTKTQTKK